MEVDSLSVQTHSPRHGRDIALRCVLVERDKELVVLERRLAEARAGAGGVIAIEAPAGNGKSRLLAAAGQMAREADMQVLLARGSQLEHEFSFNVAVQLFEPWWISAEADERARLLGGPARWAGELLSGALAGFTPSSADRGYAVIHSLFWLACNLTSQRGSERALRPLVMLVDDAHWADQPSLQFLEYLAERISDLPIALVMTIRPGEGTADRRQLIALRNAAEDAVLSPGLLSDRGVVAVVKSVFPTAQPAFYEACSRVTNGNAFLLIQLLSNVRASGDPPNAVTAERVGEMAPSSVLNAVVARLQAMPSEVGAVAWAVAVLGDGAPLSQVARLAGLDADATSRGADALADMHVLRPGSPLSFVHPLVHRSIEASMSPLRRGRAHRRAAAILAEEGAAEEQVAAHLLVATPESDPSAVEVLRSAARKALASGAAESGVRMLERALAEPPPKQIYPDALAELAQAELIAGRPQAVQRLADAINVTEEKPRRARLALSRGAALRDQGRHRDAAGVLAAALDDLTDEDEGLAADLDAAYIAAASLVPDLADEARSRGRHMLARVGDHPSVAHGAAAAHLAIQSSLHGEDRASVVALTDLAWGDGVLLRARTPDGFSWPLLTGALLYVDELERAIEICDSAAAAAQDAQLHEAHAVANYCRAWPLYEQGHIAAAAAAAEATLDAGPHGWQTHLRPVHAAIACCWVQRGQLDQAESALSILEHPQVRGGADPSMLLDARAQLRLAQLRPHDALEDATEAGRRLQSSLLAASPGALSWRSTAALAYLALGERSRARNLVTQELDQARRIRTTRVVIRDLRILGLVQGGKLGIELLTEAVQVGESYPCRLEYIHALVDLGAALRRANHRADARAPLRRALDLSHRLGATSLAERARTELAVTGARLRRIMLSGPESLTPSERRVGDLAAKGFTTREIAESLFISPKTVEFHLRHIYQKLDVGSRSELAVVLDDGEPVAEASL